MIAAHAGLVGGYGVARWTRKRQLGGVVLAAAGALTVAYVASAVALASWAVADRRA
ncbi:hypothetical protein AB0I69_30175 [Streptomyces sp. NPDC050508]|uniref:hypothetical protein n=1 Tax=Streptomyces sp. NPDC050508 TaxID=3155405 RepID=UPI003431B38B